MFGGNLSNFQCHVPGLKHVEHTYDVRGPDLYVRWEGAQGNGCEVLMECECEHVLRLTVAVTWGPRCCQCLGDKVWL